MKTANEILLEAGYSDKMIRAAECYAEDHGYADEDDKGSLMLARLLYSTTQLEDNPRAPWEPICYAD